MGAPHRRHETHEASPLATTMMATCPVVMLALNNNSHTFVGKGWGGGLGDGVVLGVIEGHPVPADKTELRQRGPPTKGYRARKEARGPRAEGTRRRELIVGLISLGAAGGGAILHGRCEWPETAEATTDGRGSEEREVGGRSSDPYLGCSPQREKIMSGCEGGGRGDHRGIRKGRRPGDWLPAAA